MEEIVVSPFCVWDSLSLTLVPLSRVTIEVFYDLFVWLFVCFDDLYFLLILHLLLSSLQPQVCAVVLVIEMIHDVSLVWKFFPLVSHFVCSARVELIS